MLSCSDSVCLEKMSIGYSYLHLKRTTPNHNIQIAMRIQMPRESSNQPSYRTQPIANSYASLCYASNGTEVEIQLASVAAATATTSRPTASTASESDNGEPETQPRPSSEPETEFSEEGCHSHEGAEYVS